MARKTNKPADEQQKPFDPWTATEEEAMALLDKNQHSKYYQWVAVRYAKHAEVRANKEGASSFCELDLLRLVCELTKRKLIVPDWLSNELRRRVEPIRRGDVKDFSKWKTGASQNRRRKDFYDYEVVAFHFVTELLVNGEGKYTTDIYKANNVYDAAADKIYEETGERLSASSIRQAWSKTKAFFKEDLPEILETYKKPK